MAKLTIMKNKINEDLLRENYITFGYLLNKLINNKQDERNNLNQPKKS